MRFFDLGRTSSKAVALTSLTTMVQLWTQSSMAQETSTKIDQVNQNTVSAPAVTPSNSTTQVGGTTVSKAAYYPSPVQNKPTLSHSINGEVNFLLENQTALTHSKIDTTVGKYFDWGSSYLSVQEVYTSFSFNDGQAQVSAGRRLEFWSQVDKEWQMALWEPQFKFDPLFPVDQGLTGIFYQQSLGHYDWVVFASPIFIPSTGPDIQEQNGNLVSDSRWYQQPATSGVILGQKTKFVYSLDVPALSQLVNNPGGGFRLRWQESPKQGPWASVNYGYKPINTLQIKYDASLVIGVNNAQIMVQPEVAYATLWGGDFGVKSDYGNFSVSYLEQDSAPNAPAYDPNTDWWQQQPGSLRIFSGHWDRAVNMKAFLEKVDFAVDYLKVYEDLTYDVDSTGVAFNAILPYQTMYTNALSIASKFPTSVNGKRVICKLKALRDFDQKGNLFQSEFDVAWTRRLSFNSGIDVLAPDDPSVPNQDPRFINQFRANDRIYGGFSYVF